VVGEHVYPWIPMMSGAAVRVYRPRAFIGGAGYVTVFIDGTAIGELWSNQVKTFDVAPGRHEIKVGAGWGWVQRSRSFSFDVGVGELANFAAAPLLTILGLACLRPATDRDKAAMDGFYAAPPVPRNLANPTTDAE
jgi:hypothetical protein